MSQLYKVLKEYHDYKQSFYVINKMDKNEAKAQIFFKIMVERKLKVPIN